MNIPQTHNQKFIDHANQHQKAFHNAEKYGVNILPVSDPTQAHWRVIGVHHLTGKENHGQHNVFCDVLDENGQRLNGTIIQILSNGSPRGTMTIDKPANEPGTNTQMHFNDTLTIFINHDGLPSEQVAGLHTRHDDEDPGTTRGHHSFYVVFQRSPGLAVADSPQPEAKETEITSLSEQEVAAAIRGQGEHLVIPLNRDGALFKAAQAQGLGEHLTDEYEAIVAGQNYTAQIFEGGLVYARTGHWDQIAMAPAPRTRGLGPVVEWTQEITGFRGNRWNYWEQNLVGKIPGYSWQMFLEECLLHNPHLAQDGFIFRPEKRYKMPKVDGQPQKPVQGQTAGPTATTTATAPAPKAPPAEFVQVKNGQFHIKGKPTRFIGANIRGLVHYGQIPDLPHTRVEQQVQQLQEAAIMNARLIRVFLAHKNSSPAQIEARLRQTLSLMKQNFPNMYLLPALTNLYDDVPFYVQGDHKFFSNGILNNDFYGGGYRENYLPFVKHIVSAFKNEPQIFAWEIGNELKAEQAPELLVNFMLDVARQIKGWDPNHMVTTGMISTRHAWMAGRQDLREKLYSSPHIDFVTIHAYDGNEKPDHEKEDDSDLAQRFRKPYIIEEAGFNKQKYANRPEKTRQDMVNWFSRGASCYMPWGFMATDFDNGDSDNIVGMGKQLPDWRELYELHRQCGECVLNHDVNDIHGLAQRIASINFMARRALRSILPWPLVTDGFDFPVGRPDGLEYYVAAGIVDEAYFKNLGSWHTGEDWNGRGGGDSDLGAPVYAIGNALVVTAQRFPTWGNVVLLEHRLPWGHTIWSQYAHLKDVYVRKGDVLRRGDELGTIGKGDNDRYIAHLHFEVRVKDLPASKWWGKTQADREKILQAYVNPTNFINANRPK